MTRLFLPVIDGNLFQRREQQQYTEKTNRYKAHVMRAWNVQTRHALCRASVRPCVSLSSACHEDTSKSSDILFPELGNNDPCPNWDKTKSHYFCPSIRNYWQKPTSQRNALSRNFRSLRFKSFVPLEKLNYCHTNLLDELSNEVNRRSAFLSKLPWRKSDSSAISLFGIWMFYCFLLSCST